MEFGSILEASKTLKILESADRVDGRRTSSKTPTSVEFIVSKNNTVKLSLEKCSLRNNLRSVCASRSLSGNDARYGKIITLKEISIGDTGKGISL